MRNFTFTMRQSDKTSPCTGTSTRVAGPTIENLERRAMFSTTSVLSLAQVPAGSEIGNIVSSLGNGGDGSMGASGNRPTPPPPKYPSVDFGNIFNVTVTTLSTVSY